MGVVVVGGSGFQRLLCLNPTTVMVVLLLGLQGWIQDQRLLKGMPKIHAHFVENESKMSKITRYPLTPEISGSNPQIW